jgi:hypothetical protein
VFGGPSPGLPIPVPALTMPAMAMATIKNAISMANFFIIQITLYISDHFIKFKLEF